jgi:hypothetical protein
LMDSKKRVFISLVILCIAWYVTVTPDVNSTFAGQWVNAGMIVVSFYLGSHTAQTTTAAKRGEDQGGDGTGGST